MVADEAAVVLRYVTIENLGEWDDYLQEYENGKMIAKVFHVLKWTPRELERRRTRSLSCHREYQALPSFHSSSRLARFLPRMLSFSFSVTSRVLIV